MPTDNAIPLQSDTLSTVPGGGIRTEQVAVSIPALASTPTIVQQQVVTLANVHGVPIDANAFLQALYVIQAQNTQIISLLATLAQIMPPDPINSPLQTSNPTLLS